MKKFIAKSLVFFLIPGLLAAGALRHLDGYTDAFYLRFTTPRQNSLILGTSRAAQGLQPQVINEALGRSDIYNYAFTVDHSPFGPTYFQSIQRKLNPQSTDGVHIIAIDPWSISSNTEDPNNTAMFSESKLALGKTKFVNLNPNIFYLLQSYGKPLRTLFPPTSNTETFLHRNGWLEVSVPMDSASVNERLDRRIADYRKNYLPQYKFSEVRWQYLLKTIELLDEHGSVYLVRLPVHPRLYDIEQEFMPDFEDRIASLGRDYLSFVDCLSDYTYTDGNHLYKSSGAAVSRSIAEWILKDID